MRLHDFLHDGPQGLTLTPPTVVQSNRVRALVITYARVLVPAAVAGGLVALSSRAPAGTLGALMQGTALLIAIALLTLPILSVREHVHTMVSLVPLDDADLPELNALAESVPGGAAYRQAVWAMGRPFHKLDRALLQTLGERTVTMIRSERHESPTLGGSLQRTETLVMPSPGTCVSFDPATRMLHLTPAMDPSSMASPRHEP